MKKKTEKIISVARLRWIYLIGVIVIIGGVMSFGLIAALFLDFDEKSALSMVWMIPPMLGIYLLAVWILLSGIEKRMGRLLTAIERVSEGDLSTQIDLKDAEEYREVYTGFNAMVRELAATKEEMDSFNNEFAHEFKTPITAIKGFADLLLETGEDIETPERVEYLQMIGRQSDRLLKLSQNVLLLSKVEAMQIVVGKETFDLAEQIRRCAILLSKKMDEKNLDFAMSEDVSVLYTANPEMMEHVWINLLDNAVKFSPEGGKIGVDFVKTQTSVQVSIVDHGPGMDEETVKHIFDLYYQHDTTSPTKGSGIGLAIVKRIVELSQGEVRVKSAPGEGTCFDVLLPLTDHEDVNMEEVVK